MAKALDKDTSLAEKIWMLFREKGIMITSILTVIFMAIDILVEALFPRGMAAGGKPPCKDGIGAKEWLRNKLKALAKLVS